MAEGWKALASKPDHLNLMPLKRTWWKGSPDPWTLSFDFCTLTMAQSGKMEEIAKWRLQRRHRSCLVNNTHTLPYFLSPPSPLLLSQRQIQPPLDFPSLFWEFYFTWENPHFTSVKDQRRFQVTWAVLLVTSLWQLSHALQTSDSLT